jgi:hypothetical protein
VITTTEPIRIALELQRGPEPLSGRVLGEGGFDRAFVGWTGLAAALTLALDDAGGAEPPAGAPDRPETSQ